MAAKEDLNEKYMDKTAKTDEMRSLLPQDHSSMLNRLLGHGSHESFEMGVVVTGQSGVGKTSLVMILVGDEAPHEAQSTDGISPLEGRCGLDIDNRDWILIAKDDYDARDVVYQKVLMTPDPKDKATGQNKPTQKKDTPSATEDTTTATEDITSATEDTTSKRHHPVQAIPNEKDIKLTTMVSTDTKQPAKIDEKIKPEKIVKSKHVSTSKQEKIKSKMTRKEIKKQMENYLERGDYKMKVGRLIFWGFGGPYYTTHQTFMTYRALFLVVFDGSKDLYDEVSDVLCFPGQHGTPTAAVFLQHWVNSILTYCKVIAGEIPQILFVATHKDKISEKDVEKRRTSLYNEIDQLFKHHEGRNHLVLKNRVFVNAMNKNDPEIAILKKIITELTFNHPCWGERMPNAWIPLELEIAELTAAGKQIMSLKEIYALNNDSEISTLSAEDVKTFLKIQHSLGKIVYFDTPQLKDYVVISPLYMVEVMKSFVTDRQFWHKGSKAKETFNKMSVHGIIQKSDLFSLWEGKKFSKIRLYKEYVFDMLVHLDILSEQRCYDLYAGTRLPVEDYFVPCMVTEQNTTNYMKNECTPQRAICLAFVFKGSIIPPALPNRLIGACLSMWCLKTYEGKQLLFSGFIGLTFDKSHDIVVRVESNIILLFILHKTSKGLIVRDIATGVKECVFATLERISAFYQSASNEKSSQQQPFHVELACSNFKCFLPETEAKASETNNVICSGCNQNYEIEIWNQDETKDDCHQSCTGLSEDALLQNPSDCEILRFARHIESDVIHDLVIHLGITGREWKNMKNDHPYSIAVVTCRILITWRERKTGTFRDLAEALTAMGVTTHKLCQVRRIKRWKEGKNREYREYIPTDEILDTLALEIGIISFELGIELGLSAGHLERIQYRYQRDLVGQTKQVLYDWRNGTTVKATLGLLGQALVNVGRGAMCLKTIVEKHYNFRQQRIQPPSERTGKYMDKTAKTDEMRLLLPQDHSSMLNRLLGQGSHESFEMRVMVTGQFGVGKTSLVMILVGDDSPHEAQSTDGISLLEGRCGLDIDSRDWILIAKDDYDARDVVYQKVLMTPDPKDKATGQNKPTQKEDTTSATEDTTTATEDITSATEDTTSKRHHPVQAIPKEKDIKFPMMVSTETTQSAKIDEKIKPEKFVKSKHVNTSKQAEMISKMTRKEIKKQMENYLERGEYKMKVGRLIFWDFGGQYVYYTTHQTFMTYRALFLVVFDGSKDLYDEVSDVLCFPGQHGTPTAAVFLQHWVNSILTYCKVIAGEIPQILFVATHKDKISEKDVEKRRTSLYKEIEQLFKHHEGRNHLVLKNRVFVNAMNKNDPEIALLKKIITDLTFEHPSWGERMPNAWIPLELEIAELTAAGKQIMSLKEIDALNNASEVSILSAEDLKTFLKLQHSLGKIVYFDTPQLKDYVVISPLYMVEVMKSFVTDRQFWPKDCKAKETFNKMSVHGIIQKSDLFSLWEQKKFSKILLYKEHVFDMLVHLDILSEQRRYDLITGSRLPVEDYFVPCMVTEQDTTNYMNNECTPKRAICLAFVFKGSIIPPALPNRLISACLSMWRLKTYEGKQLLFSGFIGLTFDKSHDIVVRVESNTILLFILHKISKGLIVPDIATGVKECLFATLERISEFYQSASNKTSSQQQPFHVELVCSNCKCFLPETEAKASETNNVICTGCKENYEIEIWNQDKTKDVCHQSCTGLSEDALLQNPSDCEIYRLSHQFDFNGIYDLVIHLGITDNEWKDMGKDHSYSIAMVKFCILITWRNRVTGTFHDLEKTLETMGVTKHTLCQVRRIKRWKEEGENRGLLAEHIDYIPTDEILDALAPEIGIKSFHLAIALGLCEVDLERIQYDYKHDLVKQTQQVLYEWRNDTTVKATLGVLGQALDNVGIGTMCLKRVVERIGVEKLYNSRQQSNQPPSERTWGRQIANMCSIY